MKKISIMDYKKRLQEVRKNKPNNLVIRRKLEIESRRRSQELENKPQQEEDADNIKKIEQKDKSEENYQYFDQNMEI